MIRRHPALLGLAWLWLCGCSLLGPRADPTRYYVLTPSRGAARPSPALPPVGLGPVTLPGYLDRPQLVTRTAENQLTLAEYDRWGEDLGDSLGRVLRQDLQERLGNQPVALYPWQSGQPPPLGVAVEVQRFERAGERAVELRARFTVRDAGGRVLATRDVDLRRATPGTTPGDAVAALSDALGALADAIADALRAAAAPSG